MDVFLLREIFQWHCINGEYCSQPWADDRKITYRDDKGDMNERRGHKVLGGFGGMLPQEISWVSESFIPDVGLIPFSPDKALQIGR